MEKITVKGMVVRVTPFQEKDRIIQILTDTHGVVSAIARNAQSLRSKYVSSTALMSYCEFELYPGKNMYSVSEASILDTFQAVREDVVKYSLSLYFMELISKLAPDEMDLSQHLRLALNCIAFLQNDKLNEKQIKAIFELRLLSMSGYMPDLVGCSRCGYFIDGGMYFSVQNADMICEECITAADGLYYRAINQTVLTAMRHIIYSPIERLFQFRLSDAGVFNLEAIVEDYLLHQTDGYFKTLNFYKSLVNGELNP